MPTVDEGVKLPGGEFDELDEILDIHTGHVEQQQTDVNIVQYQFEICDILLNIGPCGQSLVADSINSELGHNIDLVTTSGHGKNGAVSVLQRSVRPDILTTFELPDIVDMWSVFECESTNDDTTFLFLSKSP